MPKEYGTPGPRAIYPELCDSRSLARCGIVANALWPRLIAKADDQGRLAGDAADVLAECFPKMLGKVSLRQVQTALDELQANAQVRLYAAEDEPYIQITTWWSWQGAQRRAYPSRHPAPEGWTDFVYGYEDHPRTLREAQGRPPRKRGDDDQIEPSGTAPEPHDADTVTAPERQHAVSGTASEPHGAALPRTQPRARGAVPGPAYADESPQPPASGGRRTRARDLGPLRTPTRYDEDLQRESDDGVELFDRKAVAP